MFTFADGRRIAALCNAVVDRLEVVHLEWVRLRVGCDEADKREEIAFRTALKQEGVERYADLCEATRSVIDKRREEVSGLRSVADACWREHAEPIIAEFDALMEQLPVPLYRPKWTSFSSHFWGAVGERFNAERAREELRTLHLLAKTKPYYDTVIRNRKSEELGRLPLRMRFVLVRAPYGSDLKPGYYRVLSKTPKGTVVTVENRETGVREKWRAKILVQRVTPKEESRGLRLHRLAVAAASEVRDGA